MRGKEVCYHHGGKSAAGPLAPAYKHGRFSKYLPQRLHEVIQTVREGDILDLTDDIVVVSTRIADVMQRTDSGESGSLWEKAKNTFGDFRKAQAEGNKDKIIECLTALNDIFEKGAQDYQAWDEVKDLFLRRTKMVESQRKRAVEAHEMLAAQDVRAMMRAITEGLKRAVEEHVTDHELKRKIFVAASSEFTRLVNPGRIELVSTADN